MPRHYELHPDRPNSQEDPPELLLILLDDLDKVGNNSLPVAYLQVLLSGRMSSHERTSTNTLRQLSISPYISCILQAETPQLLEKMEFLQKVAQALASDLLHHSLAITQQGHLVAVPASIQPGDIAAVLYGASVVCLLRARNDAPEAADLAFDTSEKKTSETRVEDEVEEGDRATDVVGKGYNLVGEAYLHGCTDAEGIAMCVIGQLKDSDFLLRIVRPLDFNGKILVTAKAS